MVHLSPDHLGRRAEETARILALLLLDEAARALDRLRDHDDTEALHDFRVGLRRLRSALRAYRPYLKGSAAKKFHRRVGALASATNAGRDAEVQAAWLRSQVGKVKREEQVGLKWLLDRIEARHSAALQQVLGDIARDFHKIKDGLTQRLSVYKARVDGDGGEGRPSFNQAIGSLIREHLADLEECLAAVEAPDDEAELHRTRIRAKRLRYLLEPISKEVRGVRPRLRQLKRLQDVLGELNDTHILVREVAAAVEEAATEQARRLHELALQGDAETAEAGAGGRVDETRGLLALTGSLRKRRHRLFAELQSVWLGERAEAFFRRVRELGNRLGASDVEIERKFLLKTFPDALKDERGELISQGWLPGQWIQERVRRVRGADGERFYRTIKVGSGMVRRELEESISRRQFQQLWALTESRRVRKRRYEVSDGELSWQVDRFLDRDLVLAEVELPSRDTEVEVPGWLASFVAREVTGNRAYENRNLARRAAGRRTPRRRVEKRI